MKSGFVIVTVLVISAVAAVPAKPASDQAVRPKLDLKALAEPLQDLTPAERKVFDHAVELIKEKQHLEALQDLTGLIASNPKNSAVRVLRAYALLELGNITGALNEATVAEDSGVHSAYRCWFLAQVAYLAGDAPLCRREIRHVSGNPVYGPKAEKLGQHLDASK